MGKGSAPSAPLRDARIDVRTWDPERLGSLVLVETVADFADLLDWMQEQNGPPLLAQKLIVCCQYVVGRALTIDPPPRAPAAEGEEAQPNG